MNTGQIIKNLITVKTITADDWHAWREPRLRALAEDSAAFCSTLADWQGDNDTEARWRARLKTVPFNLLAFDGEIPVGMVSACLPDQNLEVNMISMWVAAEKRGLGIGKQLIASVVQWAVLRKATGICLDVKADNHAAIALYRHHGFAMTGGLTSGDEHRMCLHL